MVHHDWTNTHALVFDVASGASADIGMKRGRLPLEKGLIVGMTDDALGRFDTVNRRVTSGAFLFQEPMGGRQLAGTDEALQTPGIGRHVHLKCAQGDRRQNETEHDHHQEPLAHG